MEGGSGEDVFILDYVTNGAQNLTPISTGIMTMIKMEQLNGMK